MRPGCGTFTEDTKLHWRFSRTNFGAAEGIAAPHACKVASITRSPRGATPAKTHVIGT